MMRQYELVERISRYNPRVDEQLLNKAYVYAMQKHGSQIRASGDPYITHPLEVAALLVDLHLDDATIAVALLHDTIEDTDATRAEIDTLFGEEIGKLVEGLTKIERLDLMSRQEKQAENFRKLLIAISDDVRVLLVKLADRLHNMRTLHHMPSDKRERIAQETMEIYAPLAGRMGMHDLREELEELSFEVLYPSGYETINRRLAELRRRNKGLVDDIAHTLTRRLSESGIQALVHGREKRSYSIFRKMQRKSLAFEQLSDIYGFRIIVDTVDACYRALGVVHTTWQTVPGRFKDYISTPKQNDYRSIHTTIVGPRQQRVELQIRTHEMDRIAEYGIAAHTLYKEGFSEELHPLHLEKESQAYRWLRHTIDLLLEGNSSEEFLEHTKLELFQDQVFCFTPKGQLIALPRGATPIDFAYMVHTDLGNRCVGCKINGQIMPLVSRLRNGDEVEILSSTEAIEEGESPSVPPASWENIVVTGKARSAIRRANRMARLAHYAQLGLHVLEHACMRIGKVLSEKRLAQIPGQFDKLDVQALLAGIGDGEISLKKVLLELYPGQDLAIGTPERAGGWFKFGNCKAMKFRPAALAPCPVPLLCGVSQEPQGSDGEDRTSCRHTTASEADVLPQLRRLREDLPVIFPLDSGTIPGDCVVGIVMPGEGILVYPIDSPELARYEREPERWLDVCWEIDSQKPELFPVHIRISAINQPGCLARIAQIIGENEGNIDNVRMLRRARDFHEMLIEVEVRDVPHLDRILRELRNTPVVAQVERVRGQIL